MNSFLSRILRKLKSCAPVMRGIAKVTYSQYGEDLIMLGLIGSRFDISKATYLDIGANDPISASNTYSFYLYGCRGVLVEPNVELCKKLKRIRPNDVVLNVGISDGNTSEADYYIFAERTGLYNTFSKENAENVQAQGIALKEVMKMPLRDINEVISENFSEAPTIISLDVEGLDEVILRKLDFNRFHPLLICVETVTFNLRSEYKKIDGIIDFLFSKGYFIYADTQINTIFCSKKLYEEARA